MTNSKSPFEKIRSLVERRKLYEQLIHSRGEIICKAESEHLFTFTPFQLFGDAMVQGLLTAVDKVPQEDVAIIGNFVVGEDRYFVSGLMKFLSGEGLLHLDSDIYKLQRRASHRIQIPKEFPLELIITKHNNSLVNVGAQVVDVSAGGVRVHFCSSASNSKKIADIKDPGFKTGDTFTCSIHPPSGKVIDLQAIVKHRLEAVQDGQVISHFGCEFQLLTPILNHRLMALSLDLQRKLFTGIQEG